MKRPGTITGIVRDAKGNPVAGARVYITAAPGPVPDVAALSGADGRFELAAGTAGDYHLACSSDGMGEASAAVSVGGSQAVTVELRLSSH